MPRKGEAPNPQTSVRPKGVNLNAQEMHDAKIAFLDAFAQSGIKLVGARAANIDVSTVNRWMEHDELFAIEFNQAKRDACDRLEAEAHRRAVLGVQKAIYNRGRVVGMVTEYSDTLLIFLMKGAMPGKYRERVSLTGADDGPIEIDRKDNDSPERVAEIVRILRESGAFDEVETREARRGGGSANGAHPSPAQ